MDRLLLLRFSALGDVAMTVPVVSSLAQRYPEASITVLTRRPLAALFRTLPPNVHVRGIDLHDYSGVRGLARLYRELRTEHYTHVADLHDVLRTKYLRLLFRLDGIPVAVIDKGRRDKRRLTRRHRKVLRQLTDSFTRYSDVLARLGFRFDLRFTSIFPHGTPHTPALPALTGTKGEERWVGVAPFAKHPGKTYPIERTEQVVAALSGREQMRVFIFGGGRAEQEVAERWAATHPGVVSVIGQTDMEGELALMSRMDAMLTMDSGNMHLASLAGVPVVSVWGATHPAAGFMGWRQPQANAVQTPLPCRPCSVFGEKPCYRGDYACLHGIAPEQIIQRIDAIIR